ncbi:N-ATPase subunit AtpR [Xanthobacter agilis]|uniref:N-ATPase subunit AtpR n=1 Tax=Xanthobacter agilis TaxID=47492 RepID=UPI00372BC3BE
MALGNLMASLLPAMPELSPLAGAALGLGVGLVAGGAYFTALWWNTQLYLAGGRALVAIALQAARFALLLGAMAALALLGALPLLMGAVGLLIARTLVVRRLGRVA